MWIRGLKDAHGNLAHTRATAHDVNTGCGRRAGKGAATEIVINCGGVAVGFDIADSCGLDFLHKDAFAARKNIYGDCDFIAGFQAAIGSI